MKKIIKIAITGTESSGKSILSKQLAEHYNAELVDEFARSYLMKNGLDYTYEDILFMAKKQIEAENIAMKSNSNIIICDTDTINFKIWLEYYNYKIPDFIINHIKSKPYHFSLLLYPNTKWEIDEIRKNEKERLELYAKFEEYLKHYNYKFSIIDKLNEDRFNQSVLEINKVFKIKKHLI